MWEIHPGTSTSTTFLPIEFILCILNFIYTIPENSTRWDLQVFASVVSYSTTAVYPSGCLPCSQTYGNTDKGLGGISLQHHWKASIFIQIRRNSSNLEHPREECIFLSLSLLGFCGCLVGARQTSKQGRTVNTERFPRENLSAS